MALIKCSECGKDISDRAPACPSCGNPTTPHESTTVELTSKRWKKVHLVSWVMIAGGIVMTGNNPTHGVLFWGGINLIFLGIVVRYIGKIGAWWANR